MELMKGLMGGIAAMACMGNGHAEDMAGNIFSVSGFGTLGAVHSSYRDADFKVDSSVPTGSGRSHSWSETQMSRLGLQIDAQFSEALSAAVQGVAEYNYEGNYKPDVTLAFVKYQMTPNLVVRGGRFVMPTYMLSQFSRVGYALPWARPPLEMYRSFPTIDGADVTFKSSLGDIGVGTQTFFGRSSHKGRIAPGAETVEEKLSSVRGLAVTADAGASTFRVAYIEADSDTHNSSLDSMIANYRALGFGALADRYQPNGKTGTYTSLGYAYDPGTWFLRAEVARTGWKSSTIMPKFTDAYITAGYRLGQTTLYGIYGRGKYDGKTSIGAADPIGAINAALTANDQSRHSVSLGTRWDFRDNMALKLQLSRIIRNGDTSNAGLSYQASGSAFPAGYNVIFAGIDFLF